MPDDQPSTDTRGLHSLDDSIVALAAEPGRANLDRIWKSLTADERTIAAEAEARQNKGFRDFMQERVARHLHFRPQTIAGWPLGRTAAAFAPLRVPSWQALQELVVRYHLELRRPLMGAFLDGLGLEHEDGEAEPEELARSATPAAVEAAAEAVLREHPARDLVIYLVSLVALEMVTAAAVEPWLSSLVQEPPPEPAEESDDALHTEEADEGPSPEETDEFTTLDRQLIEAIIGSAEGIEGALNGDQVDDLIEEVAQLNSSRHRSYFHRGFRDVLFAGAPQADLKAANDDRLRWYWAGAIQGWTREKRWREIVSLYDEEAIVRELGDSGAGASDAAAWWICRALAEEGRSVEISSFLSVQALINSPRTFLRLHQHASSLLRQDRAADARGSFRLLAEAVEGFQATGMSAHEPLFLEVRRRRAHCFRQLGELESARLILRKLEQEENDPDILARVQADLGLIEGEFRRLSEARLPRDAERLPNLVDRLRRGREWYERAAAGPPSSAVHGRYCLGVLALAEERWQEAVEHLEVSYSVFAQSPDRYGQDHLLLQTRMYLGVALCQALEVDRLPTAARHLGQAASEGLVPPRWLIAQALAALHLRDPELQARTAEVFISAGGERVLDAIAEAEGTLSSPAVRAALLERARSETRSTPDRVADYHALLPRLLGAAEIEQAAEALDFLETAAERGVRTDDFLTILSDPVLHEPAWDHDAAFDARVRLLEARQRYGEAAEILTAEIHRLLSRGGEPHVDEAEGLLERLRGYGLPEGMLDHVEHRFDAVRSDLEPEEEIDTRPRPLRPVRILFVGGDERQEDAARSVTQDLRRSHPHLEVRFIHPGWGSNWSRHVDEIERALPEVDGVVLMRFMRTEFGRRVRKLIDVPWRPCFGAGRQTMLRSILRVARAVGGGNN